MVTRRLESKSAFVSVHDNGIVEVCLKPNWSEPDTPEVAIDGAKTLKKAVDGNICGILTHAPSLYVKKEFLEAYSSINIGHIASAILVQSVGSRIFANLALKFIKPIPKKRIFTNPDKAKSWLLEQIALAKQKAAPTTNS